MSETYLKIIGESSTDGLEPTGTGFAPEEHFDLLNALRQARAVAAAPAVVGPMPHIDEVGLPVTGLDGETFLGPEFIQHLVDEILWKASLDGVLPECLAGSLCDGTASGYSTIGIGAPVETYRLRVAFSSPASGEAGAAGTVSASGVW